jgi:hypothetical protein
MAIPLILGGFALAAGLLGVAGHVSAADTRGKAKSKYDDSNDKQKRVGRSLENELGATRKTSEELGLLKLNIQNNEIAKFLSLYKKLEGLLKVTEISQELIEFKEFTPEEIKSMEKTSMTASEILHGGVSSLASGALAGAGVYGSVMTLGAASTGTAISSLSGVAATNATLAWLGGGSLAAGGGGMALGTTVLGGLIAGPAILISGIIADGKADEALTKAEEFEAEVDIACEKMKTQISNYQAIQVRCNEFKMVLTELCNRLNPQLTKLENIVNQLGCGAKASEEQMKDIHITLILAKTLKDILNLNILDKQGQLTAESKNVKQMLTASGE